MFNLGEYSQGLADTTFEYSFLPHEQSIHLDFIPLVSGGEGFGTFFKTYAKYFDGLGGTYTSRSASISSS
jgi:hypothetical protein